jgi:hypothetical protein
MADIIRIKGGNGDVPTLQDRELAYRKDEKALYIGTGKENERLCGADDIKTIKSIENEINTLKQSIDNIIARLDALEHPSE